MARQVYPEFIALYRDASHRFLEIESDNSVEMERLVATAENKGWVRYVCGSRPDSSDTEVVIMVKPVQNP